MTLYYHINVTYDYTLSNLCYLHSPWSLMNLLEPDHITIAVVPIWVVVWSGHWHDVVACPPWKGLSKSYCSIATQRLRPLGYITGAGGRGRWNGEVLQWTGSMLRWGDVKARLTVTRRLEGARPVISVEVGFRRGLIRWGDIKSWFHRWAVVCVTAASIKIS